MLGKAAGVADAELARLRKDLWDSLWSSAIDVCAVPTHATLLNVSCRVTGTLTSDDAGTSFILIAEPEPPQPLSTYFPLMRQDGGAFDAALAQCTLGNPLFVYIDTHAPLPIPQAQAQLDRVVLQSQRNLRSALKLSQLGIDPLPANGVLLLFGTIGAGGLPLPGFGSFHERLNAVLLNAPVYGSIDNSSGLPVLTLRLPLAADVAGILRGAAVEFVVPLFPSPNGGRLRLRGTLDVDGPVHVVAELPLDGGAITAIGSRRFDSSSPFLQSIALPESAFRPPSGEVDLTFTLGTTPRLAMESVSLDLELDDVQLVPNLISLKQAKAAFTVFFEPHGTKSVIASLDAQATLGSGGAAVDLTCRTVYPSGQYSFGLVAGSQVDLARLLEILHVATPADAPPNGAGTNFTLEYNAPGEYLVARLSLNDPWKIGAFTCDGVTVILEGKRPSYALSAAITFGIGDIAFTALARYAQGVWVVDGSAVGRLSIAEVVGELGRFFKADLSLPSVLDEIAIEALSISFTNGEKSAVHFVCDGSFTPADDRRLDLTLNIDWTTEAGFGVYGSIAFGSHTFTFDDRAEKKSGVDGDESTKSSASWLVATYRNATTLSLNDLVAAVADIHFEELTVGVAGTFFVCGKITEPAVSTPKKIYLFGIGLEATLDLEHLPLVGERAGSASLRDLVLLYASSDLTPAQADEIARRLGPPLHLPTNPAPADAKPKVAIARGVSVGANLTIGADGRTIPLLVPQRRTPESSHPSRDGPADGHVQGELVAAAAGAGPAASSPAAGGTSNATWFEIDKTLGPVHLQRGGLSYDDGKIWLLLGAALSAGGLTLDLEGLGLGFALKQPAIPSTTLSGLGLNYSGGGAVEIQGAFFKSPDDKGHDQFLGEALVTAANYVLTAIGGYTPDESSFFIFARLDTPIGGPPYFFITGLALGFGINRNLPLPTIDELPSSFLLPRNNSFPAKLDGPNSNAQFASVLGDVNANVPAMPGQNWLAAGIDFTSFETVHSSALVTVSFGVKLEIALLGISRIAVPKGAIDPVAYAEIALEARFSEDAGLLAVEGRLTPASYLYSGLAHPTGGFAFYSWFAGEHEGDFVISLGGYHPRFKRPDHYPDVPRLGIIYQVGNLMVKGGAYFALTPSMLMAGIAIEATWKSGDLSAWFNAGVDFLLQWRPFHYEADAYVHIGASFSLDLYFFTITVTIHVGVDLHMWGPPFGGRAEIDLDIISFSVSFGAEPVRESLSWDEFKQGFFPAAAPAKNGASKIAAAVAEAPSVVDAHACTARVIDGLTRENVAPYDWVLDPNHFKIVSSTIVPSKRATLVRGGDGYALPAAGWPTDDGVAATAWETDFGVLPLQLGANEFQSEHFVAVEVLPISVDVRAGGYIAYDPHRFIARPLLRNAQSALWKAWKDDGSSGVTSSSDPNAPPLIRNVLAGVELSPPIFRPAATLPVALRTLLFDQGSEPVACRNLAPSVPASDPYAAREEREGAVLTFTSGGRVLQNAGLQLSALDAADAARAAILPELHTFGFARDLERMDVAKLARYPLWDWPEIRVLGEPVTSAPLAPVTA